MCSWRGLTGARVAPKDEDQLLRVCKYRAFGLDGFSGSFTLIPMHEQAAPALLRLIQRF
jgi:hypothetical protein